MYTCVKIFEGTSYQNKILKKINENLPFWWVVSTQQAHAAQRQQTTDLTKLKSLLQLVLVKPKSKFLCVKINKRKSDNSLTVAVLAVFQLLQCVMVPPFFLPPCIDLNSYRGKCLLGCHLSWESLSDHTAHVLNIYHQTQLPSTITVCNYTAICDQLISVSRLD